MKSKLKFLLILPALAGSLITVVAARTLLDSGDPYETPLNGTIVPQFSELELPFEHKFVAEHSLPFMASAVINVDGKGAEELFLGGAEGQADAMLRFENGAFVDVSESVGLGSDAGGGASLGALTLDIDNDGDDDLFVTRTNGVWLYTNDGGRLTGSKLAIDMKKDTSPMSIAVADLNNDGRADLFVPGYLRKELMEGQNIFNKEGYGGMSRLFMSQADGSYKDVTESSGLDYRHNSFQAAFLDFDQDNDLDLVVAHDTGQVRTWENDGKAHFTNHPNPSSDQYGYPMGIAIGDINQDGDTDLWFSNVGDTVPHMMTSGDLRDDQDFHTKWFLFQGKEGFAFEDVAAKSNVADLEFSWGGVFEDFNLDGRPDLAVSENYVELPFHKLEFMRLPGRFLLQNDKGQFSAQGESSGVVNRRYSISPVTADFNGDGYPDLVHVNLAGKSLAFLSKGGDGTSLRVQLPNDVGSIGARVEVELENGKMLRQPYVSGEGLCSDSSHIVTFGTTGNQVKKVTVRYLNGFEETKESPKTGQLIRFQHAVNQPAPSEEEAPSEGQKAPGSDEKQEAG